MDPSTNKRKETNINAGAFSHEAPERGREAVDCGENAGVGDGRTASIAGVFWGPQARSPMDTLNPYIYICMYLP